MESVAILGLGLMGGSLGLALKQIAGAGVQIRGYARRAETRALALQIRACDAVFTDPAEAVHGAGIVVACTPILDIPGLIGQIKGSLSDGAVVTDVGSTKAMLMDRVAAELRDTGACFVGSHPMAGSERTGMDAARADLYRNAVVIVTPSGVSAGDDAARRVGCMWESVGSRVVTMDATSHDRIVAGTSHVPHLIAALLVQVAARTTDAPGLFCGPGFRDSTRIASGSEIVWHDIVKSNPEAIRACLVGMRDDLDALLSDLDRGDFDAVRALLAKSRMMRESILGV